MMMLKRKAEAASTSKAAVPSMTPSGLRVGEPNNAFEQEADRVADEIMASGTPRLTPTSGRTR